MRTAVNRELSAILAAVLVLATGMAKAATSTWNGGGGANTNWTLPANWNGTAPLATNALAFDGNSGLVNTNDFPANTPFSGLTFNSGAGAFTLNGNDINFSGDITNNSANLQTINLNLALLLKPTINTASNDISIGGIISGAFGVTKTGAGTLTLTSNNLFSGMTTISAGTLSLVTGRIYSALGWANQTVTLGDGAVLELGSWGDAGSQNAGGLGQVSFYTGNLQINGGTVRYSATSADSGNLDRGFTIGAGGATLDANSGVAPFTLNQGRNFGISSSSSGTLVLAGTHNGVLNLNLGGSGGLTKEGSGTWTLSGSNTYSGITTISNGTLTLSGSGSISATPLIHLASGAATANVSAVTFHLLSSQQVSGVGTFQGNVIADTGSCIFPGGSNSIGTLTFTNSGSPALTNNGTIYIDVGVTNSDQLVVQGDLAHGPGSTLAFTNLPTMLRTGHLTILSYTGTNIGYFSQINGITPPWTVLNDPAGKRLLLYGPPDGLVISIH